MQIDEQQVFEHFFIDDIILLRNCVAVILSHTFYPHVEFPIGKITKGVESGK